MTLAELVAERNSRLRLDAWVKGGTGIAFTLVLASPIAVFAWFACAWFFGFENVTRNAFIATALVVGVTFIDALRVPNPYAGLKPLTPAEEKKRLVEDLVRSLAGGIAGVHVVRADDRTRAGFVAVATAGPANIIDAVRLLRARVPEDPRVLDEALAILKRATKKKGIDPESLEPADAYLVLLELKLLRAEDGRLVAARAAEKLLS